MKFKLIILIGIGGMIGALTRYSISEIFVAINGFPYATLIVNLAGCFLLTFLLNYDKIKQRLSTEVRTAIGTGIIGSFTTFSTFALETIQLWNNNRLLALTYILFSVCGGFSCSYFGFKLANNRQRSDII